MTSDEIDVETYKAAAIDDLTELGKMFDDPAFRATFGDEMADRIKAINDEKIQEIEEMFPESSD